MTKLIYSLVLVLFLGSTINLWAGEWNMYDLSDRNFLVLCSNGSVKSDLWKEEPKQYDEFKTEILNDLLNKKQISLSEINQSKADQFEKELNSYIKNKFESRFKFNEGWNIINNRSEPILTENNKIVFALIFDDFLPWPIKNIRKESIVKKGGINLVFIRKIYKYSENEMRPAVHRKFRAVAEKFSTELKKGKYRVSLNDNFIGSIVIK